MALMKSFTNDAAHQAKRRKTELSSLKTEAVPEKKVSAIQDENGEKDVDQVEEADEEAEDGVPPDEASEEGD